jgi:hypothetical protein
MSTLSRPGLANTVPHSLRCLCRACCDARRDEAAARLEEQRREGRRHALALIEDSAGRGVVFAPKPMPGTRKAIVARYGRVGS